MRLTTLLLLAGAVGTAPLAAQSKQPDLAATDAALARAVRNGGFRSALRTVLAEDAVLLYPGVQVVVGRDRIDRLLAAQPILDSLTAFWTPVESWISAAGDFGATLGFTAITPKGSPTAGTRAGVHIAAWRFEHDRWRLVAILLNGVAPPARAVRPDGIGPLELPRIPPEGPAGPMVKADLDFAALAGRTSSETAFREYAAPEAIFPAGGNPRRGPDQIAAVFAGDSSAWVWAPVVAGASRAGDLGFTVGESVITPKTGAPAPGKYLTIWRRLPDGRVRYLTDGGAPRPAP